MNKKHAQRLLDVASACRETKFPKDFTMTSFGHNCMTPGCALGNYAVRHDLQDQFDLDEDGDLKQVNKALRSVRHVYRGTIGWDDDSVMDWFGIERQEAKLLFDEDGCMNAQTPEEAAQFIEFFLDRKGWEVRQ